MTEPLNFIWVGPPAEVQDIIGPVTITQNMNHYYTDSEEKNPMRFWCLDSHKESYRKRFEKEGVVDIEIRSIEHYLNTCPTERKAAERILGYYKRLVGPLGRNQVLDRVRMKTTFFHYLLATQGGYVLDTNVQADLSIKVHFPAYPHFMFPKVLDNKDRPIPDVWMQYAPPEKREFAKKCLDIYLQTYDEMDRALNYDLEHDERHEWGGDLVTSPFRTLCENENTDKYQGQFGYWLCGQKVSDIYNQVPEIGVLKEYYNTHKRDAETLYPAPFFHALLDDPTSLQFDLDHGISANLHATNPSNGLAKYKANKQSLLDFALRDYHLRDSALHLPSIPLLIEHGANPMQTGWFCYDEADFWTEETPLFAGIRACTKHTDPIAALENLFTAIDEQTKIQMLHQTVQQTDASPTKITPLIFAAKYQCPSVMSYLLKNGASPNQTWEQQEKTALMEVIFNFQEGDDFQMLELLLSYKADINQGIKTHESVFGYETALTFALTLEIQNKELLNFLLRNGASLTSPINFLEPDMENKIDWMTPCGVLLLKAIQQQTKLQSTHKENSFFAHPETDVVLRPRKDHRAARPLTL